VQEPHTRSTCIRVSSHVDRLRRRWHASAHYIPWFL